MRKWLNFEIGAVICLNKNNILTLDLFQENHQNYSE